MSKLEKYQQKLDRLKEQHKVYEVKQKIRRIKKSMRTHKKHSTTKIIMLWIILNCTLVEAYSMYVMWALMDLSSLYALITAVVTETLSFAVYACKSYNETKQEEIIALERDKCHLPQSALHQTDEEADIEEPEEMAMDGGTGSGSSD